MTDALRLIADTACFSGAVSALLPQVSPAGPGCCRIEHVLAVKPMLAIPAAVAPYTSSIFKKQVALLLQDLQAEIERQAAAQAAGN
jgi:hypothetical protein